MTPSRIGGPLNPMACVLRRDRQETQTRRRSHVKREAETGGTRPRAQGRLEPQKLEEAGRTLPWSLRRENSPAWISVVLPPLGLSGPGLPGSQWPCLDLRGPAPPGSQRPCPAWISVALPCVDLSGPAPPESHWPCPAWISVALPLLSLRGPALPASQRL